MPIHHLVAMGDSILHRNLATHDGLAKITHWAYRRRGVLNARRALPILDGRAESPGESLVRAHLVFAGVPRPECNFNVIVHGEWLARVDLAWPDLRLIVEYDGLVHLEEAQRRSDATRRNLLQAAGWQVITLTASDLSKPWVMVDLVCAALRGRAALPR